jgi:hypothetical protein
MAKPQPVQALTRCARCTAIRSERLTEAVQQIAAIKSAGGSWSTRRRESRPYRKTRRQIKGSNTKAAITTVNGTALCASHATEAQRA